MQLHVIVTGKFLGFHSSVNLKKTGTKSQEVSVLRRPTDEYVNCSRVTTQTETLLFIMQLPKEIGQCVCVYEKSREINIW